MTPRKLFRRRLYHDWKYKYEVWCLVLDWTVLLYLLFPFVVFVVVQYRSWWQEDSWVSHIPPVVILLFGIVFVCSGTLRVFLQEADQLFLWRQEVWRRSLIGRGIGYSFLQTGWITGWTTIFLWPIMQVHLQLSSLSVVMGAVFAFCARFHLSLLKQVIPLYLIGWRKWLFLPLFVILIGWGMSGIGWLLFHNPMWVGVINLALMAAFVPAIKKRLIRNDIFYHDISRENRIRLAWTSFLLQAGQVHPAKPLVLGNRPWLFRSSNPIFRKRNTVNVLAETILKAIIRRELWQYLQMSGLGLSVMMVIPTPVKWGVWIMLSILFPLWVRSVFREIAGSGLIRMLLKDTKEWMAGVEKASFCLTLPITSLYGVITGWAAFGWWGIPLMVIIGGAVAYSVNAFVFELERARWETMKGV